MIRLYILGLFMAALSSLSSQTLKVDFSAYPNEQVILSLKNGIKSDTVYTGILDNKGLASITLPKRVSSYAGMATLSVGNKGGSIDFIVNGEDVVIRSSEEYPHGGNVVFENSPENTSLQDWFNTQVNRQQKLALIMELEKFYDKTDVLLPVIKKENMMLQIEQVNSELILSRSPLYAARFISLYNFNNQKVAGLAFADSLQMVTLRNDVIKNLDIKNLYTSGLWFSIINGLLAIYSEDTPFHSDFITDMCQLLKRAPDDQVYATLAENLFTICETMGWSDQEEQLAYFLVNDGRIAQPTGKLKLLMTLFKLGKGSKAPALLQGNFPAGKTLLVFYESGCGPCENELETLKGNYMDIKQKGYRVVSVSADVDADIFKNTSDTFPWSNKFCDLKGTNSPDFKNYGVLGTPTFYLIDQNGIVQGRYARLIDTGLIGS